MKRFITIIVLLQCFVIATYAGKATVGNKLPDEEYVLGSDTIGNSYEGEYVGQQTPVATWFKENQWVLWILLSCVLFMAVRAAWIDWQCLVWNLKLRRYIRHAVVDQCLSEQQEWQLRCCNLHSDYRIWIRLRIWTYRQLVTDKKLLIAVEGFEEQMCECK